MSNLVLVTLVLAGRMSGKTAVLNGYQFDDGELTLEGGREQVENIARYMQRCYQAFPKGSPEIAELNKACAAVDAAKAKEAGDGERDPDANAGSGNSEQVPGSLQQDGGGAPEETANDGGATGDPEAGTEGSVAGGDGHQDPRLPDTEEGPEHRRTREAVAALSADNEDHWTPDGDPAISAVEELMGEGGVTRDSINEVALGYTREHAKLEPGAPLEEAAEE